MIVTESEAKKLWCPFVRVLDYGAAAEGFATPNRWGVGDTIAKPAQCIASDCMAWRKVEAYDPRDKKLIRKSDGKRVTGGLSWEVEFVPVNPDDPPPEPVGYCGLAGDTQ